MEISVRVRYAETDAMGVAHHTSYLVWFEEARSEYLRQRLALRRFHFREPAL